MYINKQSEMHFPLQLSTYPVLQQFGLLFRDRLTSLGLSGKEITTIINMNSCVTSCLGKFPSVYTKLKHPLNHLSLLRTHKRSDFPSLLLSASGFRWSCYRIVGHFRNFFFELFRHLLADVFHSLR